MHCIHCTQTLGCRGVDQLRQKCACSRGNIAAWMERGEAAANQDGPIRLQRHTVNLAVCLRIEAGIQGTAGIDSRDILPGSRGWCSIGLESGERAAEQNHPVRLDCDAANVSIRFRIESQVETACGVKSRDVGAHGRRDRSVWLKGGEGTSHQNAQVRLHRHAGDITVGFWIERRVQDTADIDSRDVLPRRRGRRAIRLECGERTTEQDHPVRLNCDAQDGVVCLWIESHVESASGFESGDFVAWSLGHLASSLNRSEQTSDQNHTVGLQRDAVDGSTHARPNIECFIESAVLIDAGDAPAGGWRRCSIWLKRAEGTTKQNHAIRLNHHTVDDTIRFGIKSHVQAAARIEPCDVAAWHAVYGTEVARDDGLPIRLHCRGVNVATYNDGIEQVQSSRGTISIKHVRGIRPARGGDKDAGGACHTRRSGGGDRGGIQYSDTCRSAAADGHGGSSCEVCSGDGYVGAPCGAADGGIDGCDGRGQAKAGRGFQ